MTTPVSLVKDNITLTLSRNQWIEIRGALVYAAITDRQEGRSQMSYTVNQIRNQITQSMKRPHDCERKRTKHNSPHPMYGNSNIVVCKNSMGG